MASSELEAMYLQNLSWIDGLLATLAQRHGLEGNDAAAFTRWAKARIVENDYAALAKFRGTSAFTTYLAVVLMMLAREYVARG
jgi:hypothetical protein